MDACRKTALMALLDIDEKGGYSNIVLNNHLRGTDSENQGFIRELVYGVLRYRMQLDYYIDCLAAKGISSIKNRDKNVLRIGLYQIIYMNSVPDYAAISESVNLARKFCRGREKLINAILRSFLRNRDDLDIKRPDCMEEIENNSDKCEIDLSDEIVNFLAIKYSYHESIVRLWINQYGIAQAEKMLGEGNKIPNLTIRVNELKTDSEELEVLLKNQGFQVSQGSFSRGCLKVTGSGLLDCELYKKGFFSVQDESAAKAVEILAPEPGEKLIDMCAAPGGKCLAAAEKMNNRGHIRAFDVYDRKVEIIRREALRLGVDIVDAALADGTEMNPELKSTADRVIADVPCSGLGVVRRKPEIKYRALDEYDVEFSDLIQIQMSILKNAAEYVKPGGVLVYSTCTVNKNENEKAVERFLETNSLFYKEEEIQIFPGEYEADGFYICRLKAGRNDSNRI